MAIRPAEALAAAGCFARLGRFGARRCSPTFSLKLLMCLIECRGDLTPPRVCPARLKDNSAALAIEDPYVSVRVIGPLLGGRFSFSPVLRRLACVGG
jgi:hypothetical protein